MATSDGPPIFVPNVTLQVARGSSGGGGLPSGDFALATGHFLPAKVPPLIIHPRPSNELTTNSRASYAYPGIQYRLPIGVMGGAYPFKYEITARSGTADVANAAIGGTLVISGDELIPANDYGVIEWTPAAGDDGKTYSFDVRVTDQEGSTDTVTINGVVDSSKFVFLDPAATGGGTGTINSPFTWAETFGTDEGVINPGKFVYFREGVHTFAGHAASSNNISITGAADKPVVFLGYPGETPEIDFSAEAGHFNIFNVDDFYIENLECRDNNALDSVGSFFRMFSGGDRHTIFNNTWKNQTPAQSSSNNPACLYWSDTNGSYTYVSKNRLAGKIQAFTQLYARDDFVIEQTSTNNVTVEEADGSNAGIIYVKKSCQRGSIRDNNLTEIVFTANQAACAIATSYFQSKIEFCYNKFANPNESRNGVGALIFVDGVDGAPNTYEDIWVYRNNLDGALGSTADPITRFVWESNVQDVAAVPAGATTSTNNLENEAGAFDATSSLTGSVRSTYLGTRGAEIA
ncbi:MAG: hypothetical protein R3193_17355 [Marinobacter sp.]|nr:hypothetical protein [Marinobacter sp.]